MEKTQTWRCIMKFRSGTYRSDVEWRSSKTPEVEHDAVLLTFGRRPYGLHRFGQKQGLCSGRCRIYDIYIYNLNQFKSYIYIYIYHSSSVEYDIFFTFYFAALIIWFKGTILNSWSWEWQVWNHDSYIYLARILSPGISVVFLWNQVNIITVTDIACGVPPGHQTSNTTPLVWFWPFCYA